MNHAATTNELSLAFYVISGYEVNKFNIQDFFNKCTFLSVRELDTIICQAPALFIKTE